MPVFVQLSKHQKKEMAKHAAKCRRMNKHDQTFKSADQRERERQVELRKLAVQQAMDRGDVDGAPRMVGVL